MTDHQILDKLLEYMSNNFGEIPKRPAQIAEDAGLIIDRPKVYLMFDMMNTEGYVRCKSETNASYIILYKGVLFLKEGGYKRQKYLSDRQKIASWFSDYIDIIIKPLTVVSLIVGVTWVTIQILSKLGVCCQ